MISLRSPRSCYDNTSTFDVIFVTCRRFSVCGKELPAASSNIVTSSAARVVANYEILRTIIELSLIWRSSNVRDLSSLEQNNNHDRKCVDAAHQNLINFEIFSTRIPFSFASSASCQRLPFRLHRFESLWAFIAVATCIFHASLLSLKRLKCLHETTFN